LLRLPTDYQTPDVITGTGAELPGLPASYRWVITFPLSRYIIIIISPGLPDIAQPKPNQSWIIDVRSSVGGLYPEWFSKVSWLNCDASKSWGGLCVKDNPFFC
jgi:hypothetical protein